MVDIIASFQAAATSLSAASEITKAILGMREEAKIHAKVIELRAAIMDAQSSTLSAQASSLAQIGRIRELEQRIVQMENWEREKQRYQLHQVRPGVLTYTLKQGMEAGEPPHQLCAKCYQDGIKSILQEEQLAVGRTHLLLCHRCDSELITQGLRQESHQRRSPRR